MIRPVADRSSRNRRRVLLGLGIAAVSLFFVFGWFDRSALETVDLGSTRRIVVISDAGPVRVTEAGANQVDHRDSWLIHRPTVELGRDDDEVIVRLRCDTSWPCRSAASVRVVPGIELVVIANNGTVTVERFDGALTVFADHDQVALGPIRGSARVVAGTGDISGAGMALGQLSVDVDRASIDLEFSQPPQSVVVTSAEGPVRLSVPDTGYDVAVRVVEDRVDDVEIGVASVAGADAIISIRGSGPVVVEPFLP